MNSDAVYQLLVEANPVPDPDAQAEVPPDTVLRARFEGNSNMHTIQPETLETGDSLTPSNRKWILAAAAAVVVFLAVGLYALTREDTTDQIVPADDPPPEEPVQEESAPDPRVDEAVATGRTFYETLHAGDVDAVMAMLSTEHNSNPEADRAMFGFNTTLIENGENREITSCEPLEVTDVFVTVGCTIVTDDPIWIAFGEESVVAPAQVFDDGGVVWLPYVDHQLEAAGAMSEYLRSFADEDYMAACSPGLYPAGTVTNNKGLALTPECAEVIVAHSDDIEQWVADGQPDL